MSRRGSLTPAALELMPPPTRHTKDHEVAWAVFLGANTSTRLMAEWGVSQNCANCLLLRAVRRGAIVTDGWNGSGNYARKRFLANPDFLTSEAS